MNRINSLFRQKNRDILSVFFTAGFPGLNDTERIIQSLEKHGADMIEIGIPFSDPVADGEIIQGSSQKALRNGMNLNLLFYQIEHMREKVQIPILLMGYLNPVMNMGMENFLENCRNTGVDGVIIPDLPPEEYRDLYRESFRSAGVANVLLVTPQTSDTRIRQIDDLCEGFIYLVSSYSTTGSSGEFSDRQMDYFRRIKGMNLKNPVLTGFGISDNKSFRQACEYSSGAIIGSAFVKVLEENGFDDLVVKSFIERISPIRARS